MQTSWLALGTGKRVTVSTSLPASPSPSLSEHFHCPSHCPGEAPGGLNLVPVRKFQR